MFHHGNILAHAPFGAVDVPADGLFNTWTFRHGEFSARGIFSTRNFWHRNISARGHFGTWKVGSLSGAVTTVSAISGPTIFCSVLKNFQAVSWAGCRHRSIKVTTPSKQICIKNKVNLSSVNCKFKRRSGTSFNLSQWIKFKICLLQLKL